MFRNIQHLLGRVEIRILVLLVCGFLLISFALAVAQLTKIPSSEPSNLVSSWDDLTKKYLSFREDNYELVVPGWFLVYGQIEAILNEYGLEELQKDPEWYWTFDGGTFVFEDDSPLARQVASGTHIVIYEDSANEELLVLSEPEKEDGEYQEEIACKAPAYPEQGKGTDYESYLYSELSKRRIAWKVVLKSKSAVEKEAAEEQELLTEEGEGGELLLRMTMEEGSNHLWVSIRGPAQGLSNMEIAAHIPDGFTNRIEIFTCTNLMDAWWTLAATNLSTEGTNTVYWIHDDPEELETFFYTAGNADIDTDEDGLTDARERFLYHTDPVEPDTDGDGADDGAEVEAQTDPLNNPGDFDEDGLSDDLEVVLGTDPDEPDTDEDWVSDGYEVEKETDPLDVEDYPWLSLVINDGAAYAPSTTLEISVPGLVADTLILSESPAMDNSTTGACAETVSYVLAHDTNGTRFVSAVAVRDGVTTGFTGSSSITLDTVPPSLLVELPTNGFVTSARWIDIEGVVTDAVGNVGVKVDGDWADGIVRGAFWEHRHPLNEGSNQIEVTAWDSAGHVVTQSLQVVQDLSQDTNAPTFSLDLPSDFWVDDGVTNWSQGTTTLGDDGTLQFDGVIDDETAEASAWIERDGTTSGPFYVATGLATQMCGRIALPHGTNQLTVRAIDAAGNTSTAAWTVIRNTGCLFRISSPVPDCVINDWSVQVTCVASPWFSNAEVTVNGNAAVLTACTTTAVFQTTIPVPLQQGVTRLTARAVVNGRTYFTDSAVVAYEVTRWASIERLQLAERNYFEGPAARAGAWEYESTWECVPQLRVDWSEWTYWEMDGWGNREDYEGSSPAEWKEKRGPPAATRSGHVASGSHSIEFDISSAYAYEGFVYLKRVSFATNRETIVLQLSGFDYGRETSATMNLSEVTYRGHGGFWLGSNAAFLVNMKSGVETVISPDDFDVPAFSYTTADGGFFSSSGKWLEFNSVTTSVLKVDSVEIVGAPADGLVVENGDDVTFAAHISPAGFVPPADEPKWYYQKLKADGNWESWQSFGVNADGTQYVHAATESGIFRVKTVLTVGGAVCEKVYERTADDPYSTLLTDDPDAFGVVDDSIQITVRNTAKGKLGSTYYAAAGSLPSWRDPFSLFDGQNKCNVFVADVCEESGADVDPPVSGVYLGSPPSANNWAGMPDIYDPAAPYPIPDWTLLPDGTDPQPGRVCAGGYENANPGHCGFVDYDGRWISAGPTNVNRKAEFSNAIYKRHYVSGPVTAAGQRSY